MSGGARLPRVAEALERGRAAGLHSAAVACVDRGAAGGLLEVAVGEAPPGAAMSGDRPMLWMSMSKPITAMAIALLWQRGEVDLEAPVARYVPTFAQRDKGSITVLHLLTHTAGLRASPFNYPQDDWDTIIAKVSAQRVEPGWVVGEDAGYHVHGAWFILGEIVRRVSDVTLPAFLRRELLEPLGMTRSWVGMSEQAFDAEGDRVCPVYDTSGESPVQQPFTQREWLTGVRPGGNGVGPVSELTAFYRAMLDTLLGRRISPWSAETVARFVGRERRDTHDKTFKHVMDWGLGVMVNSSHHGAESVPYGFGLGASDEAFGHGGYQSSIVFADPPRDLVVAVVCNGFPGDAAHHRRMAEVLQAVERDLATLDKASGDMAPSAELSA
ncbi:MAG: serine hydrolase domain-containing protein [Planctomycetota bacterium]